MGNATDWSKSTISPTSWASQEINASGYNKIPVNPSNWVPGESNHPTSFLLLQTGDYLLLQTEGYIGLQQA